MQLHLILNRIGVSLLWRMNEGRLREMQRMQFSPESVSSFIA